MKSRYATIRFLSAIALAATLAPFTLQAADNPTYNPGDLILFFQQEGGTNTVYANLGNAATSFRGTTSGPGAANLVNFKDLSAQLGEAFGYGWAADATLYAGLAAVWGTDPDDESLQGGDPHRTLYVSKSRMAVGTVGLANSSGWTVNSNTGMTGASSNIFSQNNILEQSYSEATVVSPTALSRIDEQNPFLAAGVQGVAFNTFGGGVQQVGSAGSFGTFGAAGNVEFALDLYRIVAVTGIDGQVAGTLRKGTYEGTVTVNNNGQVSFVSQGAATSPYDTWMNSFATITTPADKLPTADPDVDGATNLEEFALGGNPANPADRGTRLVQAVDANGDSLGDLTLTLEVRSGATFTPAGTTLTATADEVTYRIEGSTDLATWNSPVGEVAQLGSGSPSAGYVFKTFRLTNGNGLAGKGFLRAVLVK